MSAIGTGYDLSAQTFSPAGRVFQVEYALKAVDNSSLVIAFRCADGVVFACENTVLSKLYEENTVRRSFPVERHIGFTYAGLMADGRTMVGEARGYANKYRNEWNEPIPCKRLTDQLSGLIHQYTLYGGARPFGCCFILGAFDPVDGPQLFMIEPSGVSYGYFGCAIGKNKQAAQAEIEKLKFSELSARDAVKEAARIIYASHDATKDKDFELEMAWVCADSQGQYQHVPQDLFDEAEAYAKAKMDEDSDEEDDDL